MQEPESPATTRSLAATAIAGVCLAVLGVAPASGCSRYLASSKTAEAKNSIGAIARGAAAAYEREHPVSEVVAEGQDPPQHRLCTSKGPDAPGHGPVPNSIPKGVKYQPQPTGADYDTGGPLGGWRCLRFAMTTPQYYQYHYNAGGEYVTDNPGLPGADGFEAAAKGDIDGDGDISAFSTVGKIEGKELKRATQLYIKDEFE